MDIVSIECCDGLYRLGRMILASEENAEFLKEFEHIKGCGEYVPYSPVNMLSQNSIKNSCAD